MPAVGAAGGSGAVDLGDGFDGAALCSAGEARCGACFGGGFATGASESEEDEELEEDEDEDAALLYTGLTKGFAVTAAAFFCTARRGGASSESDEEDEEEELELELEDDGDAVGRLRFAAGGLMAPCATGWLAGSFAMGTLAGATGPATTLALRGQT